jgi:prepilin-type N-terminal cleavage/methylation domain-containing protein
MNCAHTKESGFTLIEIMISAVLFVVLVGAVSGLFGQALSLQRRALGIQKVQENGQYLMESLVREIRPSQITSPDSSCDPVPDVLSRELRIVHPVNGAITFTYSKISGVGTLLRNGEPMTSADVDIAEFAFCVAGAGADGTAARITMPMTLQASAGRGGSTTAVTMQTTITSRDVTTDPWN